MTRAGWISGGWLHYAAFDLLWLNERDLRAHPLIKRKRRLEQLIPANNATLSRVLAVEEHGRELYEAAQWLEVLQDRQAAGRPDQVSQSHPRAIQLTRVSIALLLRLGRPQLGK